MSKAATTAASEARSVSSAAAAAPVMVSVALEDAEQLYELFKNVEAADRHFHTCQSVNFRDHIKAVYKAAKVSAAFEGLKRKIDEAKEV